MKRAGIVILLFGISLAAMAQPRLETPEMYVGVQGGVMASMMQFTPSVKQSAFSPFLGGNAGFVFRYAGHKYCGLQVELNWMQRGWHETETDYYRELDYLEIPFLAHIYFGKRYRGYLNLGPQIGFLIHESDKNLPSESQPQYMPADKQFDWGVAGGLGFYARTVAGVWQLEARFNYSFGSVFSNRKADYFDYSNPMNLSLNFAYMWQIKGEK